MITTLLFDLDDTLLSTSLEVFLPRYFRALAPYLAPLGDPAQMPPAVLTATQHMLAAANPTTTLEAGYVAAFTALVQQPRTVWWPLFERFYAEAYPALQRVTAPRPAARTLLQWAHAAGYEIALATHPVFSLAAVQERLRWADLADVPFALVSSLDDFHFAKPTPTYYAEVLARLGCRPEEAVMVGNDWENDIVPALALGLGAFWIAAPAAPRPTELAILGQGALEDFHIWAQTHLPMRARPRPTAQPAQALPAQLLAQLAVLNDMLTALTPEAWLARPTPTDWSPTEIICHLRDVELEVHGPRTRLVAETPNPFLSSAITDPWAVERNYQAQDGPAAWEAFCATRQETIAYLQALPAPAWANPARHAIFGPTHLAEIVGWVVDHDRLHLAQLRRASSHPTKN